MNHLEQLQESLESIVEWVGEPLQRLNISPVSKQDLEEYTARLSFHVAPSYLPFATDSSGIFCIHALPGRDALASPVVYVSTDAQQARFLCDGLPSLPSAVWLWVSSYFTSRQQLLRDAADDLARRIPEAKSVPADLWDFLQDDPVRWSGTNERVNQAWLVADVGHPFAGMPLLRRTMEVDEAMPLLKRFVQSHTPEPEVLSTFLAAQAAAGEPRKDADILTVLSAEAWRDFDCIKGFWREMGRGMCEWDCTLRNIEDPEATLGGTAFEPLIGHPDTYSGEDRQGPVQLQAVAERFRVGGDSQGELRQLRNAATLAILVAGEYPTDYADRIATACDAIAADSLAAAVARESARVHAQGP